MSVFGSRCLYTLILTAMDMAENNLPIPTEGNHDSEAVLWQNNNCECGWCSTEHGISSTQHRPDCGHIPYGIQHGYNDPYNTLRCSCPTDNLYGEDMTVPMRIRYPVEVVE